MTDGQTTSKRLTIASSVSPRCTEQVDSVVLRFTAEDVVAIAAAVGAESEKRKWTTFGPDAVR